MDGDRRSSGNHPGVIDYKGQPYVFGFNYEIMKRTVSKHNERRSVSIEKLTYNPDGTIQKLPFWSTSGVPQVGTLNPYNRVEAETIANSEGVKTMPQTEWERDQPYNRGKTVAERVVVSSINNGDFIKVQGADFGNGAATLQVSVAALYGGKMEVHTDKIDGPLISTIVVNASGEGDVWKTVSATVKSVKGVHDVYFVFKGEKDLFYFDWWQFKSK
jgi:hypothetical protein